MVKKKIDVEYLITSFVIKLIKNILRLFLET